MENTLEDAVPGGLVGVLNQEYATPFVITFAQNKKYETAASLLTAAATEQEAGAKQRRLLQDRVRP